MHVPLPLIFLQPTVHTTHWNRVNINKLNCVSESNNPFILIHQDVKNIIKYRGKHKVNSQISIDCHIYRDHTRSYHKSENGACYAWPAHYVGLVLHWPSNLTYIDSIQSEKTFRDAVSLNKDALFCCKHMKISMFHWWTFANDLRSLSKPPAELYRYREGHISEMSSIYIEQITSSGLIRKAA